MASDREVDWPQVGERAYRRTDSRIPESDYELEEIIVGEAKASEETLVEPARLTDMPGANFGGGNIAVFSREN